MAGFKEGTVVTNQTRTKQWIDLLASVFLDHLPIGWLLQENPLSDSVSKKTFDVTIYYAYLWMHYHFIK